MNNKMKKRTITGVAIISGAILVSVGVAGTIHLINENNATEAKKYVVAGNTEFNASNQNITLKKDGGTGGADSLMLTGSSGSFEIRNSAGVAIKVEGSSGYDMKVTLPTKTGYGFLGYYYGNVKVITSEGYVSKDVTQDQLARLPDAGLVAKWDGKAIALNKNGGEGGTDILILRGSSGSYSIYSNEGVPIATNVADSGTTVVPPSKTGYNFLGYYSGNILVSKSDGFLSSSLTQEQLGNIPTEGLIAKWSPVEHTVTFNANGGTGGPTTQTKTYGASLLLTSEKPTRDGFTFKEWNTSVDGTGTVYQPGGYYSADEDVTLYAQWEESEIQVNLYDDDRSTVLGTLTLKDGYFYQDGNKIEKNGKFNLPTKEGYTFVSYNGSGNSTSKWILSDGTFGSEAQYDAVYNALVDLKKTNPDYAYMSAEWESTKHMVTFNANGGNGGPTTQTKTYGESLLLTSETPTKEGCTFKGWNTNQDGTGTVYQPGGYYSADEDVTLYAQWMQVVEPPANVPVESISLDKIEATIKIGGNIQLTATVTPDNATNKNVSWESSNTAVATVDNTGYVTAKSEGTATITAKTEDGEKTATATITIEKEITDNQGPTIISITGEKDLEGNYKVIIKATDESGIQKVLVNGAEITTKDSSGNFYFIPTKNGTYKIEVYDTEGNKTEQDYTENNIIEKTKITAEKDSNGNNIVYIETITNKKVTSVKVNGTEIKDKDSKGRYYFKPTQNGTYKVTVEYEDGTTEEVEYTENRITNNNNGNNSGNNNTNNGNSSTNNGNNGSNNSGTNTGNSNKGSGTLTSGKSTSGNTIGTSTALTSLPKTGTKMGAFFAAIASGITAVFAWFKQRKEK